MKKLIQLGFLSIACNSFAANPEPVIYGTATDSTGKQVTGTIRWGDQEAFLSDIFNGNKVDTVGIEHLSKDEKQALEAHQPGPQANIGDIKITFKSFFGNELKRPYFNLPFGAMAKIEVDSDNNQFIVTLHDGTQIKAANDSNDLTDEIFFLTAEGDTIKYDLEDLTSITFSAAPENAKSFDQGIYGTITSDLGTFTGRVMWDQDERMVSEKLDGHENGQEYNLKFAEIRSIERQGNKSLVELLDGKSLLLGDTNDVDNGNRGIWLDNPELGRVEIKWSQFHKFEIHEVAVNWLTFDDYQSVNQPLKGQIRLKDQSTVPADQITFDLNHQSPLERLDVEVNDSNHLIPFGKIKQIKVLNENAVELKMSNDSTQIAYGKRSVTRDNNGVLIKSGDKHRWLIWAEIDNISFE
jgi:hypothetical protein